MRNELTILNALKNTIINGDIKGLDSSNTLIDFPDTDKMPNNICVYLQPNWADYENLSTKSDYSTFDVSLFILCKKDTRENLTLKIYSLFNSLYNLLKTNTSLSEEADFTEITNAEFYPSVEGNLNVKGIEVSVNIHYTKDF